MHTQFGVPIKIGHVLHTQFEVPNKIGHVVYAQFGVPTEIVHVLHTISEYLPKLGMLSIPNLEYPLTLST